MENIADINDGLQRARAILKDGGLVAVPTETVYGLAALATNDDAVAKIYKTKGRPSFNPLISHVADLEMAQRYAVFNDIAVRLAEAFWPGPLTLVLPSVPHSGLADAVTAQLPTVALRQPKGVMASLAAALDAPLAAPSANSSGKISPTSAQHVAADLGNKVDLILDGGRCKVGVESTILKIEEQQPVLLREGGISSEDIEAVIGPVAKRDDHIKLEAPGMMLAHYAPRARLRLNSGDVADHEFLLAFGEVGIRTGPTRNLSPTSDLAEAAYNLFAMMKELDELHAEFIAVHPIPMHGIGAAINDRLKRAAYREQE